MDYEAVMLRALQYIDEHLQHAITVAGVAGAVHMSPYHFHRVFTAWAGEPLMTYVRRRRLAYAATALSVHGRTIQDIALDCQFASQATFTRAFQQAYGVTPGRYRRSGALPSADPAFKRHADREANRLTRIVDGPALTFIGLELRDLDTGEPNSSRIESLWNVFMSRAHEIQNMGGVSYGVCIPTEGTKFNYMAAVAVDPPVSVPEGMVRFSIKPQTYAAFSHDGHVTQIVNTFEYIWSEGLAATGQEYKEGVPDLEVYRAVQEDAMQIEIWIPVR